MVHARLVLSRRFWRRVLALGLIVLGALFLWLSPDHLVGAITVMAGIALEVLGIHLEHG